MYSTEPLPLPVVRDGAQPLLSPADFAKASGVSLSTIWRQLRRGELPSIKQRGKRLIPASALAKRGAASAALTKNHPIWALVGAGKSGGAGPGSSNKRAYLAEEAAGRRR
jgi:hypothetical protein